MLSFGSAAGGVEDREFYGPFPSWINVKTEFGATGNGSTDDTAAIQAAFNQSLSNQIAGRGRVVIYLPAGTYKISDTIFAPRQDAGNPTNASYSNVMFVGEDPATTTIKWAGPAGGTMMWINGVNGMQVGRITWDGSGTASICVRHEWLNYGNYSTNNHHFDEVFKNAEYGLRITDVNGDNQGDAEAGVYRCTFKNLSQAGTRIDSPNAYDWWFWYCRFENNAVGIMNPFGNFSVYGSIFKNSTDGDLKVGDARYFAARDNYSIGSRRFLSVRPLGPVTNFGGSWVLQGNRVIDPTLTDAIQIAGGSFGTLMLMDNVIANKAGVTQGPVVRKVWKTGTPEQKIFSIGNTYTVANPIEDLWEASDQVKDVRVARSTVSTTEPTLPGTPPRVSRTVFEVPPAMSWDSVTGTAALQNTINAAAAHATANPGSKPIVHLGAGTASDGSGRFSWTIKQPIVVPANVEMTILGDAQYSRINANASDGLAAGQPLLILRGPSRATVHDIKFTVFNGTNNIAIVVDQCDQPGSRVYLENAVPTGSDTDLFVNGLVNTKVNVHSAQATTYKIVGGATPGPSRTAVFGAASSDAVTQMFHVSNGGRFLIRDFWYESNTTAHILRAVGSGPQRGLVALECAYVYNNNQDFSPAYTLDNFDGAVTMIAGSWGGSTVFTNGTGQLDYLKVGGYSGNRDPSSATAQYALFTDELGAAGTQNRTFLESMLTFNRTTKPEFIDTLPLGVTDSRLIGLQAAFTGTTQGIVLVPNTWN